MLLALGGLVCEVRGLELTGRAAFAPYLGVHLSYLGGGVGRRLGVLTDWITARAGRAQHQVIEGQRATGEGRVP